MRVIDATLSRSQIRAERAPTPAYPAAWEPPLLVICDLLILARVTGARPAICKP